MPTYEVDVRGRTFDVDAPNERAAVAAAQKYSTLPANAEPVTEGTRARVQSQDRPWSYIGHTLANIPGDALAQGKGIVSGIAALLRGEVDVAGIPGAVADHYAGYADGDERARRVRESPVGTVLDIIPGVKGLQLGQRAARAGVARAGTIAAPGILTAGRNLAAKYPTVSGLAKDAALDAVPGGHTAARVLSLGQRLVNEGRKATTNAAESERMVGGMSAAGGATADAAHPYLRTSTRPGILTGNMSAVELDDALKAAKKALKATTDASERAGLEADIAVLEKSLRQRMKITHSTQMREARKLTTREIAEAELQRAGGGQ